jgi:predicted ribosomally synthesized peptide with nif11-like leader
MSWFEFERFVDDVEGDRMMQRVLSHCRGREELLLLARRLGYELTRDDLRRAFEEDRQERAERMIEG